MSRCKIAGSERQRRYPLQIESHAHTPESIFWLEARYNLHVYWQSTLLWIWLSMEVDATTNQMRRLESIILETPKVLGEGQATNPIRV